MHVYAVDTAHSEIGSLSKQCVRTTYVDAQESPTVCTVHLDSDRMRMGYTSCRWWVDVWEDNSFSCRGCVCRRAHCNLICIVLT